MSFVLDCSIAVTWYFQDEASPVTDTLLDCLQSDGAVVPILWHLELANVLAQGERRGRLTAAELAVRLDLMAKLPLVTDSATAAQAWRETLALARGQRLTTYDAAYLELAMRLGSPLATRDKALRQAAARLEVPLLP